MIISNKQVQNVLKIYGEQTKITKNAKTEKNSMVQKPDEFIMSTNAQDFGHILKALSEVPEVRADKVAEVSTKIDNGIYHVEAMDIAEKMLGRALVDNVR